MYIVGISTEMPWSPGVCSYKLVSFESSALRKAPDECYVKQRLLGHSLARQPARGLPLLRVFDHLTKNGQSHECSATNTMYSF